MSNEMQCKIEQNVDNQISLNIYQLLVYLLTESEPDLKTNYD